MHRRKKRFKQVLAGTLALSMAAISALTAAPAPKVNAAESKTDEEWAKVSAMLDEYVGIYTKDTNVAAAADTIYGPDGPFMGNGLLYGFMGVDAETQNIYISRGDMW